jgi:hypothetical protein
MLLGSAGEKVLDESIGVKLSLLRLMRSYFICHAVIKQKTAQLNR